MKRLLTLLIALAIPVVLSAQVMVPQTTKAFYNKSTASWCPPCGGWGSVSNINIENGLSGKAVVMKLTGSSTGLLYNRVCSDLYAKYDTKGHNGVPNFYLNASNETVYAASGGIYSGQTEQACINGANAFYSANSADVNAGFHSEITADSIVIDVTTTFFHDMDGAYYTAVYVIENGISYPQAQTSAPTKTVVGSHFVRKAATANSFGDLFPIGSPRAGDTDTKHYVFGKDISWNTAELHVITVVWKAVGASGYEFVNANDVMSPATGISVSPEAVSFSIYPNPVQDVLHLTTQENEMQSITIFNILGEQMTTMLADQNTSQLDLDVSTFQNGVYIAQLVDAQNRRTSIRFVKK